MGKTALLIGRFQPFHSEHLKLAGNALEHSDNLLILAGSANLGRTTRNPFTYYERETMIAQTLYDHGLMDRTEIMPLDDQPYDMQTWIKSVQEKVTAFAKGNDVALAGFEKDASSYYLRKFPQYGVIAPPHTKIINATEIRDAFFDGSLALSQSLDLPGAVRDFLTRTLFSTYYDSIRADLEFERAYREQWGPGPFQTVDAVCIRSGHVALVERGRAPGKGLLAFPGGHLELGETLADGCLRELFEETRLFEETSSMDERKQEVWQHFRKRERFDDPKRSCRAHVITEAFLFKFPDSREPFPELTGSDDAARAFWKPLAEITPAMMFEDHGFILNKMLCYL